MFPNLKNLLFYLMNIIGLNKIKKQLDTVLEGSDLLIDGLMITINGFFVTITIFLY